MQKYFLCVLETEARSRAISNGDKGRYVSIISTFQIFQMRFSELLSGRWNSTEHKSVRDLTLSRFKGTTWSQGTPSKYPGNKRGALFPPDSQAEPAQMHGLCNPRPAPPAPGLKSGAPSAGV